jgi:hypothetical protein
VNIPDPKFQELEDVYHITPESPKGVVIDINYNLRTGQFSYQVTFSATEPSLWYYEEELSKNRRIV